MIHSSQIAKVGLCILGASTLVGSGFGIHSSLQDKTIEHIVIRKGKELINKKEVFEVAFKQHKEDTEFLKLVDINEVTKIDIPLLEKAATNLSNWCNENRKILLTDKKAKELIPKVEKYCTKPFTTIKARLDKLGKKLTSSWKARLEKISNWQQNDTLKKDLATVVSGVNSNNGDQTADVWGVALNSWCTGKVNTSLLEDRNDDIFNKINEWCLEQKG